MTGWKVGYVAAPAALSAEFRKVHQFNVFTVNTPMQHGLAGYMADPAPSPRAAGLLPAQARPVPRRPREARRFELLPADGTYFQCVDYRRGERPAARPSSAAGSRREIGVAAIPLSAFYGDGFEQRIARFCFAKKDETLDLALDRLRRL